MMNGVGANEVIVETPRHERSLHELEVDEVADVIRTWVARMIDLEGDKRATAFWRHATQRCLV
jgi:UDPglucose--hexose-1-phosphate uridylyltransferase